MDTIDSCRHCGVSFALPAIAVLLFATQAFADEAVTELMKVAYKGENFVVVEPTSAEAQIVNRRLNLPSNVFVTINSEELLSLVRRHQVPVVPTFASFRSSKLGHAARLDMVGVKDRYVWRCILDGSLVNLQKLGSVVENDDPRINDYHRSVTNSRVMLAYHSGESGLSAVTAVLRSDEAVYSVRKLVDSSFSIQHLGLISE